MGHCSQPLRLHWWLPRQTSLPPWGILGGPGPLLASQVHLAQRLWCTKTDAYLGIVQKLTVQDAAQRGEADGHHAGPGRRAGQ